MEGLDLTQWLSSEIKLRITAAQVENYIVVD